MNVFRANCRCGWQSAWCFSRILADTLAADHEDYQTDHLTYVSFGEFLDRKVKP